MIMLIRSADPPVSKGPAVPISSAPMGPAVPIDGFGARRSQSSRVPGALGKGAALLRPSQQSGGGPTVPRPHRHGAGAAQIRTQQEKIEKNGGGRRPFQQSCPSCGKDFSASLGACPTCEPAKSRRRGSSDGNGPTTVECSEEELWLCSMRSSVFAAKERGTRSREGGHTNNKTVYPHGEQNLSIP